MTIIAKQLKITLCKDESENMMANTPPPEISEAGIYFAIGMIALGALVGLALLLKVLLGLIDLL